MKIGLLFNCQGTVIARSLRLLLPSAAITSVMIASAAQGAEGRRDAEDLAGFDYVLAMDMSSQAMAPFIKKFREGGAKVHRLPSFRFWGFHPDSLYIMREGGGKLLGPTSGYQSRIAVIGFLAGLSPDETVGLYNGLSYRRLKYLDEYRVQMELLTETFRRSGIDLDGVMQGLPPRRAYMHIFNHPKVPPLLEVARAACGLMNIEIERHDVSVSELYDDLEKAPSHPIFPEIAEAIGFEPEGCYKAAAPEGSVARTYSLDEFVSKSFECFETIRAQALLGADGVREGLAAMKLEVSEKRFVSNGSGNAAGKMRRNQPA